MRRGRALAAAGVAAVAAAAFAGAHVAQAVSRDGHDHASGSSCVLGNRDSRIQHVIYLQFDNTHYNRDNPNVPSDLEQMPHLLNFLKGDGTLSRTTTRSSSRTRRAGSSRR